MQGAYLQLEGCHGALRLECCAGQRVNLADPTQDASAREHLGRAARLQPGGVVCLKRTETHLAHAQLAQEVFHRALGVKEVELDSLLVPARVHKRAAQDTGQKHALLGVLAALCRAKAHAALKELDVFDAAGLVVAHAAHEAGDDAAAQDGLLAAHGVDDLYRLAAVALGHAQAVEVCRVDQRVGHRLVKAAGAQCATHELQALLLEGAATGLAGSRQRHRHAVQTPDAHDLLVEIDLADKVRAEGRRKDGDLLVAGLALDTAAQIGKDGDLLLIRDICADELAQARRAQGELDFLSLDGIDVHDALAHRAAAHACHEGRGDGGVLIAGARVHTALVAQGRLAHQAQVTARAARVRGREGRALQQHVNRGIGDLGLKPAHDASQGHVCVAVGDHRHIACELALCAVKRGELGAVLCRTHHDMALASGIGRKGVEVKGMQGLAQLEEDVVGHIDDVVDGAAAHSGQALDHPVGRRPHLDAADNTGGVALAQLFVIDGDIYDVADVLVVLGAGQLAGSLVAPGHVVHGAHLARKALHAQAVRAVGRDLQIQHLVA